MVAADPARIDARLDSRHIYTQVPAFSSGDRGIIDLLGVTRDGRLAVLELKASEDIQLVMQAVDYWLRVRWHQEQDDFRRYGYFPDVALQAKPPLLFLVAPGFRFHPANDIVLRYLSRKSKSCASAWARTGAEACGWSSGNNRKSRRLAELPRKMGLKKEKQPWRANAASRGVSLKWFV